MSHFKKTTLVTFVDKCLTSFSFMQVGQQFQIPKNSKMARRSFQANHFLSLKLSYLRIPQLRLQALKIKPNIQNVIINYSEKKLINNIVLFEH